MNSAPGKGVFAKLLARLPRRLTDARYTALAKHIEQRASVASLEAHAYVVHRLAAFRKVPAEAIEARALLASQEAKAYADDAVHSLSMALRGMAKVLARINRRINALETAQSETRGEILDLTQALQGLEKALADRSPLLTGDFEVLSLRIDESAEIGRTAQKRVGKIDDDFLNLSTDFVGLETALREIDTRLNALIRHTDMPAPAHTHGLRPPTSTDVMSARLKK